MSEEDTPSMPRFLQRLKIIVETCPPEIAGWTAEGDNYEVYSLDFEKILQEHFVNGNVNSFKRQLAYYGFARRTIGNNRWSFSHAKFRRDNLKKMAEIKRSTTRMDAFATVGAVKALSQQVAEIRDKLNWLLNHMGHHEEIVSTRRNRHTEEAILHASQFSDAMAGKDTRPPKKRTWNTANDLPKVPTETLNTATQRKNMVGEVMVEDEDEMKMGGDGKRLKRSKV